LRGWQSDERGMAPLYPSKAADTCPDTLNHSTFSVRSQDEDRGIHPPDFYDFIIPPLQSYNMASPKRPRAADYDPPPPPLPPPSRAKSSGVRISARLARPSEVRAPARLAKPSGVRASTRQAMSSRPTRGKPSIVRTPTETQSITTSEHHGDSPQDASDAGNSHGSSYTLTGRELAREVLKIVNNADSAELMID
jgi:hypothetical protein